jgi:sulfhydrogenase subunit beta (sulfur reductase)
MDGHLLLQKSDLGALLEELARSYDVYVPVKKGNHRFYERFQPPAADMVVGEVRCSEPLKAFFSRARELVAEDFRKDVPHSADRPVAVVGAKACDLKGFKIQDHVFSDNGWRDPLYLQNRERNLIIGSDCTCAIDTCFCLAAGIQPHPREDFDLNLSQIEGAFVVEVGSEKGRAVVEQNSALFAKAEQAAVARRDEIRAQVIREVEENVRAHEVPAQDRLEGVVKKNYQSEIWNDEAKTCVECGACTIICPTCHCFLLYDQKDEESLARLRVWDSCMIKDYARVAGGANPRPKLWMRLRNRFEKKFDFFPRIAGVTACTGCGRCISACPAKIDIRRVLKRLVESPR